MSSLQRVLAAVLGVNIVLGCARQMPPAVPVVATEAPVQRRESSPSEAGASTQRATATPMDCPDTLPPVDLLKDNMRSTSMSGLAEILSAKVMALDGTIPPPRTGYVNYQYEVRVLEWFAGSGPVRLTLVQGAEAGGRPGGPGALLLFSACADREAFAYEPDVAYFVLLDPACQTEAAKLGASAAEGAGIGPKTPPRRKPSACTH